jgi:chromosome segregation ATPase
MHIAYIMLPEEDRIRVNGRVPRELYADISTYYANITTAINDAFELLRQEKTGQLHKDCGINMQNDATSIQAQLDATRMQIDANNMQIEFLKEQIQIKDSQQDVRIQDLQEQLKGKDENQLARIIDLKEEITLLRDQLKEKDMQIKNLTTITESQVKGYKLIEAPGAKKPWWRFW